MELCLRYEGLVSFQQKLVPHIETIYTLETNQLNPRAISLFGAINLGGSPLPRSSQVSSHDLAMQKKKTSGLPRIVIRRDWWSCWMWIGMLWWRTWLPYVLYKYYITFVMFYNCIRQIVYIITFVTIWFFPFAGGLLAIHESMATTVAAGFVGNKTRFVQSKTNLARWPARSITWGSRHSAHEKNNGLFLDEL